MSHIHLQLIDHPMKYSLAEKKTNTHQWPGYACAVAFFFRAVKKLKAVLCCIFPLTDGCISPYTLLREFFLADRTRYYVSTQRNNHLQLL